MTQQRELPALHHDREGFRLSAADPGERTLQSLLGVGIAHSQRIAKDRQRVAIAEHLVGAAISMDDAHPAVDDKHRRRQLLEQFDESRCVRRRLMARDGRREMRQKRVKPPLRLDVDETRGLIAKGDE